MQHLRLHIQWLIVPFVLLFFWLALDSLVGDSPTMDEQNHLARGVAFLHTADPRLSVEHPPLINTLSALPLLTLPEVRLPLDDQSWERQPAEIFWYIFAEKFMWEMGNDVGRMVFLGRLPIVFLTLALALIAFHFARLLWGGVMAPLTAFAALLLDPNIIAHGRLITTDLGGTTFVLLATAVLYWCWHTAHGRGGWWRGVAVIALTLGLAFSSKLLALAFVPIWALLALLPLGAGAGGGWRAAPVRLAQFLLAGFFSISVVWAVYAFEWGHFLFLSDGLAALNAFRGPMPTFWSGIERIALLGGGGRATFLLGRFSDNGFWLYFPIAFLAKTPLITLITLPIAAVILLRDGANRGRALFLLIPIFAYFAISLGSALNIGYRHLLPIIPFVYLLIAGGLQAAGGRWQVAGSRWAAPGGKPLSFILYPLSFTILLALAALSIHPHYLSSFNLLAGGPENGRNLLIDSNIDWGQDLLRLRQWMVENRVERVKLAWFGSADPAYYGLQFDPLPGLPRHFDLWWHVPFDRANPEPGIYAISVTNLWELPLRDEEKTVFAYFRGRDPSAQIGYSILIFEVEDE